MRADEGTWEALDQPDRMVAIPYAATFSHKEWSSIKRDGKPYFVTEAWTLDVAGDTLHVRRHGSRCLYRVRFSRKQDRYVVDHALALEDSDVDHGVRFLDFLIRVGGLGEDLDYHDTVGRLSPLPEDPTSC